MNDPYSTGLFERASDLFGLTLRIGDSISDEELEGLLSLLPRDPAAGLGAFLAPHVREASIPFLKMIGRWLIDARRASQGDEYVILAPFNFPPELVTVFDNARVLTCELLTTIGVVGLEGQGERYFDAAIGLGLPDHICSSSSIELGSLLSGASLRPDALISAGPGGCDANAKIHEFVSVQLDIPQLILEKPVDDTPRGRELYVANYRSLIRGLENLCGRKLTEEMLRPVVQRSNRCTELYWELWELRKARPSPVPNLFSMLIYGVRFSTWGTDQGIEMLQKLVDVAKDRLRRGEYPAKRERARCLWGYTSIYFDFSGLFNWSEEQGISHMGDILDLFCPQPIDTTSLDSMVRGMALEASNMPMTRQMGGSSMSQCWVEDVLHAVHDLGADSVIYCGHHACKQTWSVVEILRKELMRRAGIPLLVLQTDSWIRRMTPIGVVQDEIQSFVRNVLQDDSSRTRRPRKRAELVG
ncbi:MAG: 2-hydroxyacyl-CoA dehydratase family protein [Candidatus Alcyoniella australis]|nr:2-hydroxyacyl-CoA dehydratase family protein [Candidatus Alcyoniella australis]